jgi:hypothetical protein
MEEVQLSEGLLRFKADGLMAFSVDNFKTTISNGGGLARSNMYRVFLPSLGSGDTFAINALCKAATLPGRQITSTEHTMGTTLRKYASGFATTDVTFTFHVTNDHAIKTYFEEWQNLAHNRQTKEVGYYNDYVRPVLIQHVQRGNTFNLLQKQLGFTKNIPQFILERLPDIGPFDLDNGRINLNIGFRETPVYTCLLEEAYPTTINDISLTDELDGIMELQVQLSYKDWVSGRAQPRDNFADSILGTGVRKIIDIFD